MKPLECSYFNRGACRSCSLLAEPPQERNAAKLSRLTEWAARELGDSVEVLPLWSPRAIFPSRSKAKLSVSGTTSQPIIGLLGTEEAGFSAQELLDCPLHMPELNEVLHAVNAAIIRNGITPYDIPSRRGELKGLILKSVIAPEKQILLRWVLRSRLQLEQVTRATREIQLALPWVRVASVNLQPVPHAILEGAEELMLTAQADLWESYGEFQLAFGPQSFSQVTYETARALYLELRARLRKNPVDRLLDLYCGVGGFSYAAAPYVKSSVGVELSPQAIRLAESARTKNQAEHASFVAADAEEFVRAYTGPRPQAILVNPPRRGLSPTLIDALAQQAPQRIYYSSCNPMTLLRDLKLLQSKGYRTTDLKPFDMFPLTEHLEVFAELLGPNQTLTDP